MDTNIFESLFRESEEQWSRGRYMRDAMVSRAVIFLAQSSLFKNNAIKGINILANDYYMPTLPFPAETVKYFMRREAGEMQEFINLYLWFPSLPSRGIYSPVILPPDPEKYELPGDLFIVIALDKAFFEYVGLKVFKYNGAEEQSEFEEVWSDNQHY